MKAKDQKASRELVADIMAEQLGHDETLTKQMIPPFALGCRRMTPGSGYLQSLRAENVEVIPQSALRLTETGIVDESGVEHEVDVVVCATGKKTTTTYQYGRCANEPQALTHPSRHISKFMVETTLKSMSNLAISPSDTWASRPRISLTCSC